MSDSKKENQELRSAKDLTPNPNKLMISQRQSQIEPFESIEIKSIKMGTVESESPNRISPLKFTPLKSSIPERRKESLFLFELDNYDPNTCRICNQSGNLISICNCDVSILYNQILVHARCIKQTIQQRKIDEYNISSVQCEKCSQTYKMIRIDTIQIKSQISQKPILRGILLRFALISILIGILCGLCYWLYSSIKDYSNQSSLVCIICFLMVISLLLVAYQLLEILSLVTYSTWEIVDVKTAYYLPMISIVELNEIEKQFQPEIQVGLHQILPINK